MIHKLYVNYTSFGTNHIRELLQQSHKIISCKNGHCCDAATERSIVQRALFRISYDRNIRQSAVDGVELGGHITCQYNP